MSRTKRIYNSYEKYGRFMPKNSWTRTYIKLDKVIHELPQKFSIKNESHHKRINIGYDNRRWHPYAVWCMGNCKYCQNLYGKARQKRAKKTQKRNDMKFDWFFDYP